MVARTVAKKTAVPAKKAPAPSPEEETHELVTTAPDDWEFKTVAEEGATTVVFDDIGDIFVGQYVGTEHIEPDNGKDDPFDRFTFRGRNGVLYAINQSYKLSQAMDKVSPGDWVRLTYVKDIETKRGLQAMKDFRVEVRTN